MTVRAKKSIADLSAAGIEELPASFGGLRVQVTDPTIPELIVAQKGFAAAEALALNIDSLTAEITYKPPRNAGAQARQGAHEGHRPCQPGRRLDAAQGFSRRAPARA